MGEANDLRAWLAAHGLEAIADRLLAQDIGLDLLPDLSGRDLRELGLSLGQRKRLLRAAAELAVAAGTAADADGPPGGPAEAEHRQLTILFGDMVGSTRLTRALDREDMFALVGAYRRACTAVIEGFGGYVAQHLGDGVLAYFGFPRAREDDAERAVRAGLELVAAVRALATPPGVELHARVGIDTGPVVVGDLIGAGAMRDGTVVGDTPNLAARLQTVAPSDSVVISDSTAALTGCLFTRADLGLHALKGFAEPQRAWRVIGEGEAQGRFEARLTRGLTPLVGRAQELQLALERWRQAQAGEGQVILLGGEGGIGKSRLVDSLDRAIGQQPLARVRYFCSQFFAGAALHPVIEQVRRAAGILGDDPPEARLGKLEGLLRQAGEDPVQGGPLLATLCSVPEGGRYPRSSLSPQARKGATFALLLRQLAATARELPLLVLVEDAHWIDPTTGEYLAALVERVRDLPILVIVTHRPEFAPSWRGQPHVTALQLGRFGRQQAAELMERTAGGKSLPEPIRELILGRTDGVPLFVEELTKAVLESDAIAEGPSGYELVGPLPLVRIPATLHDSLMARLDRLGAAKEAALWASVLGRSFTRELLVATSPLPPRATEDALTRLVDAGMVSRYGHGGEEVHEFRHALIQDAAYQSMLRGRRQDMHARVARVLEERFPEMSATRPEVLAHHFVEAALPDRGYPHAVRAGDLAAGRYACPEARLRYETALRLARQLPPSTDAMRCEIRAILKLATVAVGQAQVEADLAELQQARSLAASLQHQPRLSQALYWMGRLHYVAGRFDEAVDMARRALETADELGDERLAAAPVNLLARIHCLRGEPAQGTAYAERSALQMGRLGDQVEEAAITGVLAFALALHGRFAEALSAAARGVDLAERQGHVPTRAACHFFEGVAHGWRGDLAAAEPCFSRAETLAEAAGDIFRRYLVHGWRGEARLLAGAATAACEDLGRCLELGRKIGSDFHRGGFQALHASALLATGETAHGRLVAEAAREEAERAHQAWSRSLALAALAEASLAEPGPDPAAGERLIREAIAVQEAQELRCHLARSRVVLARVLNARGEAARAQRELALAVGEARAMGAENAVRFLAVA